jgi:hypothetical protein
MKVKIYIGAAIAGALLFVAGHVTARGGLTLNPKTQENLATTVHGEAFAYPSISSTQSTLSKMGIPNWRNYSEQVCLAKIKSACEINNIKRHRVTCYMDENRLGAESFGEKQQRGDEKNRQKGQRRSYRPWQCGILTNDEAAF